MKFPPDSIELRPRIAVVGSGPGGALAATLMAEAGLDVLLIEEGEFLPLDSAPHFSREEILQKYRNAAVNVTMGGTKIAWVEGRCVGGGSEVNRGLYHRVPDEVLAAWQRSHSVRDLDPDSLRPHFEAVESALAVSHLPGEAPPVSLMLRDGAAALGWKCLEVPRLVRYERAADGQIVADKQSMTTTLIPRFLSAGGRLLADTRVRRLARLGGQWRLDAEHTAGGVRRPVEITASEVFVACGAVHTPALLRRSGITRRVGDTLRFHPMVKAVARFPDEVNVPTELEPVHQVKQFDPRFSMGCSISKRPALALALADRPELLPEVDRDWRHLAIYYAQSTGGLASVRPMPLFRDPLVRARRDPADMRTLAEGLRRLAECLFAAGAEAVYPGLPGLPLLRSPADLGALPEQLPATSGGVTAMHLFSSCPMGEDASRCATDSYGRVHGAEGLHIADASLLPGATVVNPQGTVMAVVHRNVQHYLDSIGAPIRAPAMAARRKERGARSEERGARSEERGARSEERGARSEDDEGSRRGPRRNSSAGAPSTHNSQLTTPQA
jgi:choline dehydrogenase-like flavoprotein